MDVSIRCATGEDARSIQRIYSPFVQDTPVSFEEEPPAVQEIESRLSEGVSSFPWLIAEAEGEVAGFACASPHRPRASYRWSVDTTIYLDPPFRGRGIGKLLYRVLIEILRAQGFYNAYAGIALPNLASVSLHESLGYKSVAVYENVGFKLDRWHSVGWWHLRLLPTTRQVKEPTMFRDFKLYEEFENLLGDVYRL